MDEFCRQSRLFNNKQIVLSMLLLRLLPLACLMNGLLLTTPFVAAQGIYAPPPRPATGWRPAGRPLASPQHQHPGMARATRFAPPPTIRDYSWIYIDEQQPREFKVNDIVTVIVSEKSEVTLKSRFNRQRTSTFTSELKEFVRLNPALTLENSASTSPGIDANQSDRIQATGQVTDAEGITYRIAATIVDIRPNGNLVLEARKKINAGDDLWEYTLHGEVRYEDVLSNNTVLSENIANLNIEKRQDGRNYSSVKRRWGTKLYDLLWPF